MKKNVKKDQIVADLWREFKKDMQKIVDRKGSGASKMTLSFKGGEVVVAEKKK